MKAIQEEKQEVLIKNIEATIKSFETEFNSKVGMGSLTQILLHYNTPGSLLENKGLYLESFNRAGSIASFAGPYLVSEWYKRNLYMYSIIQKTLGVKDSKAVVR